MRRRLRSCRGAAAFTLIEVIAALGISLVLMAAVYGAFLLYSRIMVTAARPIDQGQREQRMPRPEQEAGIRRRPEQLHALTRPTQAQKDVVEVEVRASRHQP